MIQAVLFECYDHFLTKTQKKKAKNLHKREIFLIFAADLKHKKMEIYKYQAEIDALIQQGLK